MSFLLKDMPTSEKPRERAKMYGFAFLSEVELLAILLRCGTKNLSVKDLSLKILEKEEEVGGFDNLRLSSLLEIYGMGEAKAITILAALEFAKRRNKETVEGRRKIKETKDVWHFYQNYFEGSTQEKFLVLFLDTKNYILSEKVLFIGTVNQSMIHPRDMFREAILNNAVKILCIHNHPSGNPVPSKSDKLVTKRIKESGELLGILLLDHVVIGENSYYSFVEENEIV